MHSWETAKRDIFKGGLFDKFFIIGRKYTLLDINTIYHPFVMFDTSQVNPARRDNNNMVMNAQGGMVADDDDEEFGQRDWLDYLHTFARVMVLVSIVYFYSNFTRFLFVLAFFVVVYL